jgi:catechol 2,3-dioxygenase-like lactoylglutathione lyase family enzyme
MTLQLTLAVDDIERSKRFYSEGLGCTIQQDAGVYVNLLLSDGSSTLGLMTREALAQEARIGTNASGFPGVMLQHGVGSQAEVDATLAAAERAGGRIAKPAERAPWAYRGYVADPDGYLWQIATAAAS